MNSMANSKLANVNVFSKWFALFIQLFIDFFLGETLEQPDLFSRKYLVALAFEVGEYGIGVAMS
jgi:hypothetical protein